MSVQSLYIVKKLLTYDILPAARDDAAPADDQSEQKLASLSFSISTIELGRPTLLALEVAWWRSLAERLPRGMDEAVGRGARSAQRAQQLPDLHWHGINSRRRGDAMQS